jgi:hypothetical protein
MRPIPHAYVLLAGAVFCACAAGGVSEGVGVGAFKPGNPAPAPALATGVYSGRLIDGFETRAFTLCGGNEKWWLSGETTAVQEFIRAHQATVHPDGRGNARLYVSVRGTPSATGNHGHLGQYPRELVAVEVLEVREYRADDCNGRPGV